MEESRIEEDVTLAVREPAELERVATAIRELLENDLAEEAVARFTRLRAPDQADVMARLARELQSALLGRLEARSVGMIIEELEPAVAVEVSQGMQPEELSQVLDETSPDVAADVLRGLPEDVATRTLENMREAEDVAPLMEYEDDDAGGLMTPEFIALRDRMTVSQAMAIRLRG